MSENTQAVETEAIEQDVTQEEQVETKQERQSVPLHAPSLGKQSQPRSQKHAQAGKRSKLKQSKRPKAKANASQS